MRRPGRSRAHERQRQNRVPFVRDGGADKPRRGGVFPWGDSPGGRLAPFLPDRQQFHDSPIKSAAIQNHRPSHRPSSTSLTESPLRGSAGVPLTCNAGRTPLLYRRPPCLCVSLFYGSGRNGSRRVHRPLARARASRRGLSENVSVPRRRPGRFPCPQVLMSSAAAGGAVRSWNCRDASRTNATKKAPSRPARRGARDLRRSMHMVPNVLELFLRPHELEDNARRTAC